MLSRPIRLAIVDDHVLLRKTLRNYLLDQRNVSVVIQTSDIPELLDNLGSSAVDIVIMDSMVSGMNTLLVFIKISLKMISDQS